MTENVRLPEYLADRTVLFPEEVAEVLQVSRWTVYELVKRHKLPAAKIGRGIRIPASAVVEFVSAGGTDVLSGKEIG